MRSLPPCILVALFLPVAFSFVTAPSRTLWVHPSVGRSQQVNPCSASSKLILKAEDFQNPAEEVEPLLDKADNAIIDKVIRLGNHVPALASLYYFGLVSMASMNMVQEPVTATLASVVTRNVGPTTAKTFSAYFPTLVTPATFVFYVWPLISVSQLAAVGWSAIRPGDEPILSQNYLTALSLANVAAAAWLVISSRVTAGILPLGCLLTLPLVPILSGYPLRELESSGLAKKVTLKNFSFQVMSSFTTIASFLALAQEMQHGGRIPFVSGRAEVAAVTFLLCYLGNLLLPNRGIVKRYVNLGAIVGILWKRVADAWAASGAGGVARLALSVSAVGTAALAFMAAKRVVNDDD